jgi:hypothetical protein
MTRPLTLGGIATAALTVTLLTGCTAAPPSSTSPAPTSGTTPAPTAIAPTPEPIAVPAAATCDTVLSAEGYQKIAGDGLEPLASPQVFDDLAIRMVAAGGIACAWGRPNTDLVLTVVQVGFAPAEQPTWSQAIDESGYVLTDDPIPGAYSGPADAANGIMPVAVPTSEVLTFVSSPAFAGLIAQAN